ncbi:MAG TPA: DUF192 domain-containing protein [Steroidobacteraceae bacterium]|nr:DUF192 domain-containing protein [Steroidobacteraceae bacterium]
MNEQPLRRAVLTAALALALAGLGAFPAPLRAQTGPLQDLATFPRTTLEIRGRSSTHQFDVWVADTEDRQAQGLMFVRDLPANEGMLFVRCCSGIWMKNTYIPLDIVFVGPDGRIFKIAADARPFDETTIPAGQAVSAVVELKGGEAAREGIKVGDRVEWHASPAPTHAKN